MQVEKRLTIHDIARLAGVSVATVSRVLNGNLKVDQELVERVNDIVRKTGYTPSRMAQSFSRGTSNTVVLLCDVPQSEVAELENAPEIRRDPTLQPGTYLSDSYLAGFVAGVNDMLLRQGYHLKLIHIPARMHYDSSEEVSAWLKPVLDPIDSSGVIILNPAEHDTLLECLADTALPGLLVGRSSTAGNFPILDVDNVGGARAVTAYLLEQNHTNIVFLAPEADLTVINDRKKGFQQAFAEAGKNLPSGWWLRIPVKNDSLFPFLEARNCVEAALRESFTFTALVAFNDEMAFGAMQAIVARGLRIPEDISVVGFDDVPTARMYSPPLTTVRQNVRYLGQQAARLLLKKTRKTSVPSLTVLPTELVVRESAGRWEPIKGKSMDHDHQRTETD